MDTAERSVETLFQQLGLAGDSRSVEAFISEHLRLIRLYVWRMHLSGRLDRQPLSMKP